MTMKLLTGPVSMFGRKVEAALAEKGLDCEIEYVPFDFRTRYDPVHPDVLRLNPKRQVPVLIDDGLELFDSTQIFEYLEHRYPAPPLWPDGPAERARARQQELISDEVFFARVATLIQAPRDARSERQAARQAIEEDYDRLDAHLEARDWLAQSYSYADIAFFFAQSFAAWLGADIAERHGNVRAWRHRTQSRPAVGAVARSLGDYIDRHGMRPPAFLLDGEVTPSRT